MIRFYPICLCLCLYWWVFRDTGEDSYFYFCLLEIRGGIICFYPIPKLRSLFLIIDPESRFLTSPTIDYADADNDSESWQWHGAACWERARWLTHAVMGGGVYQYVAHRHPHLAQVIRVRYSAVRLPLHPPLGFCMQIYAQFMRRYLINMRQYHWR